MVIELDGLTVSDLQKLIHDKQGIVLSQDDIRRRLNKFSTIEEVIKTPPHRRKMYKYHNRVVSFADIVRLSGMSEMTVMNRLKKGMTVEQTIETPKRTCKRELIPTTLPFDLAKDARAYAKSHRMSLSALFESLLNERLSVKDKKDKADEAGKQ